MCDPNSPSLTYVCAANGDGPSLLDALAIEEVINDDADNAPLSPSIRHDDPYLHTAESFNESCNKKKKRAKAAKDRSASKRAKGNSSKYKPGDKCPWWRDDLRDLYAQVPSSNADARAGDFQLVQRPGKQKPCHWFSVKSTPLSHAADGPAAASSSQSQHVNWRVLMEVDPSEVWSEETGAAYRHAANAKDTEPESEPVKQSRCRKTGMRLTRDQKRLLRVWMGAYRLTYNRAVELVRRNRGWTAASCQYLNEQLVYASKNGRSSRVNKNSSDEKKEESAQKSAQMDAKRQRLGVEVGKLVEEYPWLESIPTCIRKEACRDVQKACSSNDAKAKKAATQGKCFKWSLKFKNRRDDSGWTIRIPQQALAEAWTLPRPDTRRPRKDGAPHKEETRRNWTKLSIAPSTDLEPVWLTEELPSEAFREFEGGRGKNKGTKYALTKDVVVTVSKRGRFYMSVAYDIEPTPPTAKPPEQRKVGAVDPGDRVQSTVCSPSDGTVVQYAVGKEGGGKDRVFGLCEKVDKHVTSAKANKPTAKLSRQARWLLHSEVEPLKAQRDEVKADASLSPEQRDAALKQLRKAIDAKIAERWRSSSGRQQDTPSKVRRRMRSMAVLRQKIHDLVTEARNKIVLDMTRRWDTLILPPFETQGMVRRKGRKGGARKLHSKVARSLMTWRHYDFRIHAKRAFLRAGGEMLESDERYTTMTCGACGILNEKHSNESWTCRHCGVFHLRDPAASRCIFIKALGKDSATSMDVDQEPVAGFSPPNAEPPGDDA